MEQCITVIFNTLSIDITMIWWFQWRCFKALLECFGCCKPFRALSLLISHKGIQVLNSRCDWEWVDAQEHTCFAFSSTATMVENYFWTSKTVSPVPSTTPWPPSQFVCPYNSLSLSLFLQVSFFLLFSLSPHLLKEPHNTNGNHFDLVDKGTKVVPLSFQHSCTGCKC